ncbi:hypothetical protein DSCOOX_39090 [Desulfosarcina ovata subsp. ovata]|uniref:DUF1254 domain-containing protein n=1 Tax=Desulfosarcina ovata subsp. ovata TaxID=2752305 RepID=A0A5K8ADU6_9BACT|nr:hypothetical protein DSCOOX_39090 [Desulfosarcina ovata subsp. ovata]
MKASPGVPQTAINQFGHVRDLRDAEYKTIPTPNNDTLYSHAFLDLTAEPIVIGVPAIKDRYYVLPLLSAYQDVFAHIGTRETGTNAGAYVIVGPDWKGELPEKLTRIDSPTNLAVIWGRTVVYGKGDLKKARNIQDSYSLIPLSKYDKLERSPDPDWDSSKIRVAQTAFNSKGDVPDSLMFFDELGKAMRMTPIRNEERAFVDQFKNIGLTRERGFDFKSLDAPTIMGLSRAASAAELMIDGAAAYRGISVNGWFFNTSAGVFGNDFLFRAAVAKWYMGANVPEEAMYYVARTASDGKPFNGVAKYSLHFPAPPPAKAFWSLSMYNASDGSLVENSMNRYSIGDRTEGLAVKTDKSIEIQIQHKEPTQGETNWLPAPAGPFYLVLRLYMPESDVVSGKWTPPEVKAISK